MKNATYLGISGTDNLRIGEFVGQKNPETGESLVAVKASVVSAHLQPCFGLAVVVENPHAPYI